MNRNSKSQVVTDYERIAKAIAYIQRHANSQPPLENIARAAGLSPYHFQRMFGRWAGTTPKRYLQVLTLERAKKLLLDSKSLLETSESVGLSSGSRLYDHFVQLEAVTPGEFKREGEGIVIEYGIGDTPFGPAFVGMTERGICSFEFVDRKISPHLASLESAWPKAKRRENQRRVLATLKELFKKQGRPKRPIPVLVHGTNFQVNIWKALLRIPPGSVTSYGQLAGAIGSPRGARAVGSAMGDNPVAYLIPCHRVIRQSGAIGDYHWGSVRKQALLAWEAAQLD
ncbi:MAG: methylated-DNA--[protein]-cysteine S-methyltransferase [Acidiferrobacterales bacterium]|nr:methylated-DNA--[protein]-cysteine S-methyltransferase [Acidiferrobacterales bacterium]